MIRKQVLDNGLTLLTESMPQVRSVTVGVWLKRGSRHESARLNGISHFIEHLVFKGTATRSARDIALAMDTVGGQIDAFTSKEYTCFYAKVLDEHLDVALDLLADIVQHPRFDAEELERERKVVLEEIRMVEDTPDELLYDLYSEHGYPGQALGRPIQGTQATVGALTRRQLTTFFRRSYRPDHLILAAAGNLKHAPFAKKVRRAFAELAPGDPFQGGIARARHRPMRITRRKRDLEQLHLLLGLTAHAESLEERYPIYVLNTILGGTMSSRLFQRIREERGLAYTVYSAVNAFLDTGLLAIYAGTSPDKGDEVVGLVMEELASLRDQGPGEQETRVAREHLKGSLMLSLESTSSRMSNLARQEIFFQRQRTLAETLRGVGCVTVDDVHQAARRLLAGRQLGLAAVGRVGRLKTAEEALRL